MPWIQIAGIHDLEEAELLINCGVRHLGFPLHLPVHREDCSEKKAAEIIQKLPSDVTAILITYLDKAENVLKSCQVLGVTTVQLHGEIFPEDCQKLKQEGLTLIKSLIVKEGNQRELEKTLEDYSSIVDMFIIDTYDPKTGASGATGKTHDWSVSRRLVQISPKPVILAGGLNPENVSAAIEYVKPFGVDVHTGVEESTGRKEAPRIQAFLRASRAITTRTSSGY